MSDPRSRSCSPPLELRLRKGVQPVKQRERAPRPLFAPVRCDDAESAGRLSRFASSGRAPGRPPPHLALTGYTRSPARPRRRPPRRQLPGQPRHASRRPAVAQRPDSARLRPAADRPFPRRCLTTAGAAQDHRIDVPGSSRPPRHNPHGRFAPARRLVVTTPRVVACPRPPAVVRILPPGQRVARAGLVLGPPAVAGQAGGVSRRGSRRGGRRRRRRRRRRIRGLRGPRGRRGRAGSPCVPADR